MSCPRPRAPNELSNSPIMRGFVGTHVSMGLCHSFQSRWFRDNVTKKMPNLKPIFVFLTDAWSFPWVQSHNLWLSVSLASKRRIGQKLWMISRGNLGIPCHGVVPNEPNELYFFPCPVPIPNPSPLEIIGIQEKSPPLVKCNG